MTTIPGDNELKLSREAVESIIRAHATLLLGTNVRITRVSFSGYGGNCTIDFTSDPPPAPHEIDATPMGEALVREEPF